MSLTFGSYLLSVSFWLKIEENIYHFFCAMKCEDDTSSFYCLKTLSGIVAFLNQSFPEFIFSEIVLKHMLLNGIALNI